MDVGTVSQGTRQEKGVSSMLPKLTSPFCASLSETRARDLTSSVEEGQQYL